MQIPYTSFVTLISLQFQSQKYQKVKDKVTTYFHESQEGSYSPNDTDILYAIIPENICFTNGNHYSEC